jgi:hypothetical protein
MRVSPEVVTRVNVIVRLGALALNIVLTCAHFLSFPDLSRAR